MARSMHRHVWLTRLLNMLVLAVMVMSFAGVSSILPALADDAPAVEDEAPATEEAPAEEPPAEEAPAEEPPAEEPPAEEAPVEEPPVEEAPAEEPPAEEAPAEEPPAEEPAETDAAVETFGTVPAATVVEETTRLTVAPEVVEPAAPPPTTTHFVTADLVSGNPTCGDVSVGAGYAEFKIDPYAGGTWSLTGGGSVTVTKVGSNNDQFHFSSTGIKVHNVVVKSSDWANWYAYGSTGVTSDTDLFSVMKDDESGYHAVSHISFCYTNTPSDGHIIVRKFHDQENFGERDGGEPWLAGWEFLLERGDGDSGPWTTVDTSVTVGPNGQVDFGNQPAGWYRITETLKDGWECTTGNPLIFYHTAERNSEKWFGNKEIPNVKKNFKLYLDGDDSMPDVTTFWVKYKVDGVEVGPFQLDSGSDPYSMSTPMEYPQGTVISDVWWMAKWDPSGSAPAMMIPLCVTETGEGEVLHRDKVNEARYGGRINGHKYEDFNADGLKNGADDGLPGWTIVLEYKIGDSWVEYGRRTTNSNGFYDFESVLPGTYRAYEETQTGWAQSFPAGKYSKECTINGLNIPSGLTGVTCIGDTCSLDFLNYRTASVEGYKFDDWNHNGAWNSGEPGLYGWVFYVDYDGNEWPSAGEPWAMSDATGHYWIDGIKPGTWTVREVLLGTWTQSYGTFTETFESGQHYVDPTILDEYTGKYDFGNWIHRGCIEGTKWHDRNGDGIRDAGEEGLPGWSVFVDYNDNAAWDVGEPGAVTTTDGEYHIYDVLPGMWKVYEVGQMYWFQTFPATGYNTATVYPDQTSADIDFGNHTVGKFSGTKFHDKDADGVQEAGENGLAGWVIYVDYNNNGVLDSGEPSATTDANGDYTVEGVMVGEWKVREVGQPDWTQSYPADFHTVTITSLGMDDGNDFGNYTYGGLMGHKYEDKDADGVKDAEDLGLEGWEITLSGTSNAGALVNMSTTTDTNGEFRFEQVPPGTYTLSETLVSGWTQSYPAAGTHQVTVVSGQFDEADHYFMNWNPIDPSGFKIFDVDGDGDIYEGEPGLEGWLITLSGTAGDGSSVEMTTTTAADGSWSFPTVPPGTYVIYETQQSGWLQTFPASGSYSGVTLESSQEPVDGFDFGNTQKVTKDWELIWFSGDLPSGSTFSVSFDTSYTGGVPPISEHASHQLALEESATAPGTYNASIDVWPGTVITNIQWWAHWLGDDILLGTDSVPEPVTEDMTNFFGIQARDNAAAIKFNDLNGNGEYDEGEYPLSGWTMELYRELQDGSWALYGSKVTDANGEVSWTGLLPGEYYIVEVQQTGWVQTAGPTDSSDSFPVPDEGVHVVLFGNTQLMDLNGFKWDDTPDRAIAPDDPGDGIWDATEPPLPGWEITLTGTTTTGTPVSLTTTTDANGYYEFTGLMPGEYEITEMIPVPADPNEPVWFQTYPDQNYDPSLNSVFWPATTSHSISLPGGEEGSPYNFGNFLEPPLTFEIDVGIVKSVNTPVAEAGEILTYTLTYTNYGSDLVDQPVTIVDDFDGTYLSVHDANGGTVSGTTITWDLIENMVKGESKTLTYQLKVADELPEGHIEMPNVVVIDTPGDKDPSNNSDDELVTAGEPFLPFTGSDYARLAALMILALAMGVALRRVAVVRTH